MPGLSDNESRGVCRQFGYFGKAQHRLCLPAQSLLPYEDAAYNCQEGHADRQRKPVPYCASIAFAHYKCNLRVKLADSIEALAYPLNNFVGFVIATESFPQIVPQGLLNDGCA